MRVVFLATILWFIAGICALSAAVYGLIGFLLTSDDMDLLVVYARSMALGFLPWLAAYALTRVLYGMEAARGD